MTRRARRGHGAVVTAVVVMICLPALRASAGTSDDAEELVERAREVAAEGSFAGVVEVRWRDDDGAEQVQRVGARAVEGAFVIVKGLNKALGHGDERVTDAAARERTRWSAVGRDREAPDPGEHWALDVSDGAPVADRPCVVVTARDEDGRVRARFSMDRDTGQLLERVVLDSEGAPVRTVRFVDIVTGESIQPAPTLQRGDDVPGPEAIDELPEGFFSADEVGDGYRLIGSYRHPDGSVQLYYSDGLFTLSVFQEEGRVDWNALPGGSPGTPDELRGRSYSTPAGTIVVWGEAGIAFTAVGDGPPDAVHAAALDLGGHSDASWMEDVADFVLGPFGWD